MVSDATVKLQSLKIKMAEILENHYTAPTNPGDMCRNLKCKCIVTLDEIEHWTMNNDGIKNREKDKIDNDV